MKASDIAALVGGELIGDGDKDLGLEEDHDISANNEAVCTFSERPRGRNLSP